MAVTIPPASPTVIAITPTTAGFGSAYSRAVMLYDADVGVGRAAAESGMVLTRASCQSPGEMGPIANAISRTLRLRIRLGPTAGGREDGSMGWQVDHPASQPDVTTR